MEQGKGGGEKSHVGAQILKPCALTPRFLPCASSLPQGLSPKERLAVKLRLSEKRIISSTMDAVRQRLAPVRGIPTKSGQMQVRAVSLAVTSL